MTDDSTDRKPGGPGLVFGPGPEGWWDSERVSSPRVLRADDGSWRMWYYGRDPSFDRDINLPTGRCGLAISADGLHWQRVRGPGVMGAVLDPHPDPDRFDGAHLGVSDVIDDNGLLWMWYFGGSQATQSIGPYKVRGFDLRPGCAVSRDGLHWARVEGPYAGAMLDLGPPGGFDALMCGWPQLVRLPGGGWRMYYHALSLADGFQIGVAFSDDGLVWQRHGAPLLGKGPEDAFDSNGCGTRQVLYHQGRWIMLYEGVRPNGDRSMGLAESDDGLAWRKIGGPEPDGSVFAHAPSGSGAWDAHAVGCPCIVPMPGGGLRMYYIGSCHFGPGTGEMGLLHQIGCAESTDGDPTRWRRVEIG